MPFQCTASGTRAFALFNSYPVAVQEIAEGHDTASSMRSAAPVMCCSTQLVPFQCSTSGSFRLPVRVEPMAVHELAAAQDTESRMGEELLGSCGVAWMAQAVPFQRSMNGTDCVGLLPRSPMATQSEGAGQDTSSSEASLLPGGGVGRTAQLVPFQASASVV